MMTIQKKAHSEQLRAMPYLLAVAVGLLALFWAVPSVHAEENTSSDAPASISNALHDGSGSGGGGGGGEIEIEGVLVIAPTQFVGDWFVSPAPGVTVTVVLTDSPTIPTEIEHFEGLPTVGTWLQAKGAFQADGSLLASRVRPDEYRAGHLVVRLKPGANTDSFAATYDLTLLLTMPVTADIYLFSTDEDEASELSAIIQDQAVEWAEFNFVSKIPTGNPYRSWDWGGPDDSGYINQQAFAQVNLAPAQAQFDGAGVVVAVLDTGVDLEHPVFAAKQQAGHLTVIQGSDLISATSSPDDVGPGLAWGHGTHVAGVIDQIAPQSTLMPVRVLDSSGRGDSFLLAYAIEKVVASGADVINLSLGADCGSAVLSTTIQSAIAHGVVVVAAAGNDNTAAAQCPAGFPGVISVAAVDGSGQKAVFSNFGAWVDLAAPGVGVTSTIPLETGYQYATWSGTSMAAPFASGAAALARQKLPSATPADIDDLLYSKGDDVDAGNPSYTGQLGRHLDIGLALVDAAPPTPPTVPPSTPGSPSGTQVFLPLVIR